MKACVGKTKAGESCRAAAGPGGLCYFHANPEAAKGLGQIGGMKNRKFTGFDMQVPDNITAVDLCKLDVQAVRGLLSGDIPAREATAVAQMFTLLHRHLPSADLKNVSHSWRKPLDLFRCLLTYASLVSQTRTRMNRWIHRWALLTQRPMKYRTTKVDQENG